MAAEDASGRVIEVNKGVIGPRAPRPKTVRPRKISDYPAVPAVYLEVAQKLSSPLALGPPICDELIAVVQHLFTEEEAGVARHLARFTGRNAAELARAERRPLDEVEPILRRLGFEKRVIGAGGPDEDPRYRMMPLMPGVFEMVLISETIDSMSPWHRRFAELFEALYETGYSTEYQDKPVYFTRALSVGAAIDAHPAALPSDRLEAVLDRFEVFGIGECQCRTSAEVAGHGCGRPKGNCTVMGEWAERGIREGWLKPVSRRGALEIKREAESHGLVTWIVNVESAKGQASCSCCGCCCKAFRLVTEFNVPGAIAPAHFLPRFDLAQCSFCGKCARNCPLGAIAIDTREKTHRHLRERCIGCGLCAVACDARKAVGMEPVPRYKLPYRSWFSMLAMNVPGMAATAWKAWRRHRPDSP
jgi:electron transport complex protein RnfB